MRQRERNVEVNKHSMKVLVQLAKSICAINLREKVTTLDATFAVLLYEETLVAKHGSHFLRRNVTPSHFRNPLDRYDGNTTREKLESLQSQLYKLLSGYVT